MVNSVISGLKYISVCNKFQFLILFFCILFRSNNIVSNTYIVFMLPYLCSSYKSTHLILWVGSIMCLFIMEIEAQGSPVIQSHSQQVSELGVSPWGLQSWCYLICLLFKSSGLSMHLRTMYLIHIQSSPLWLPMQCFVS